jgi:hypothetical protein
MTPINTSANALAYQWAVIGLYLDLPETPVNDSLSDRQQARRWFAGGVPLATVEAALLLGSLRRLHRPAEAPPLAPIRSLAYFHPVVQELLETPVPDGYGAYLQAKMKSYLRDHPGLDSAAGPL